jgi:2-methylcitrate dehydratase PrpD
LATITQRLAAFCSELSLDQVPHDVVWKAKSCLLNGLGVAMAAHTSPSARLAEAAVLDMAATTGGPSTTLLSAAKTSPANAACANAVLFNGRNQSDSYHTATHFGPTVIPPALAVAEMSGASGAAVLEAVIAGIEVSAAIARAHVNVSVERGWRGSPIFGIFGAAAASARLLGLDTDKTANALGFAACFAAGSVESITAKTMEAQLEMGQCVLNGVFSALLAKHGGRAAPTAIEGDAGFLRLYAGTTADQDSIAGSLGQDWEIRQVTFKRYPASMIAQSPIHLTLGLQREQHIDPADVEHVLIELNPFEADYPGPGRVGEDSSNERYTVQGVAVALTHGRVTFPLMRQRDDAAVQALMRRIEFVGAADVAPLCTRMTVRLRDREIRLEATEGPAGHFLDYAGVSDLVRGLAPETRGAETAVAQLIEQLQMVEQAERIDHIVQLAATHSA